MTTTTNGAGKVESGGGGVVSQSNDDRSTNFVSPLNLSTTQQRINVVNGGVHDGGAPDGGRGGRGGPPLQPAGGGGVDGRPSVDIVADSTEGVDDSQRGGSAQSAVQSSMSTSGHVQVPPQKSQSADYLHPTHEDTDADCAGLNDGKRCRSADSLKPGADGPLRYSGLATSELEPRGGGGSGSSSGGGGLSQQHQLIATECADDLDHYLSQTLSAGRARGLLMKMYGGGGHAPSTPDGMPALVAAVEGDQSEDDAAALFGFESTSSRRQRKRARRMSGGGLDGRVANGWRNSVDHNVVGGGQSVDPTTPSTPVSDLSSSNHGDANQSSGGGSYGQMSSAWPSSARSIGVTRQLGQKSGMDGGGRDDGETFVLSNKNRLLMCSHCNIIYMDQTMYYLHMGLHNLNNPWQCNLCGTVCANVQQFSSHVIHY